MLDAFHHVAPRPGSLIAGKVRLVEPLGLGATGAVWRGVHVVLGSSVAVKVLRNAVVTSPSARARFEKEAVISARLGEASRHIARVFDCGVLEDGTPFVVMEHLKGETLADRLRHGPLPLTEVAAIVAQLSRALATAHKASVLHRDLKPANVFLCEDEEGERLVKLVDFGMAKMLEDDGFRPTQSGEIIGTPGFMSPEQVTGEETVDARSDLWSLGAMVYCMVTGSAPYGHANVIELGDRMLASEPPPPTHLASHLPPALDVWMARALAHRKSDRFATAAEMSDALSAIAYAPLEMRSATPTLPDARASSSGLRALVVAATATALTMIVCAMQIHARPKKAPSHEAPQQTQTTQETAPVLPRDPPDILVAAPVVDIPVIDLVAEPPSKEPIRHAPKRRARAEAHDAGAPAE